MGRHKQFRPDDVVDCVMDVFWNNGYAANSSRAGRRGRHRRQPPLQRVRQQARTLPAGTAPVHDQRTGHLIRLLAGRECPHRRGWLAVNIAVELGGRDESAAGVVHGMFGRLEDAVRQAIEEGRRSGELDAGRDPAATAASVLATVSGLGVLARLDVRPDRVDAVIRTTVATL
jgi:TetR/AcrR family transcriptional regulator, transcriptional repressor for nem operon